MNISEFSQCSACGACENICPQKAISMDKSTLFYTPAVDAELCVDCGLCAKVCPVNRDTPQASPLAAYGGWHKEADVVRKSSSGGAFYGLAQSVLRKGGVVFGAAYVADCKTVEFLSTDEVPLERLMKSKYVESLVGLSFRRVCEELDRGRSVLFCGTPCQVAGLKSFLREDHPLLLTCDFACGGLPSHAIYGQYVRDLEARYGAPITGMDFRPKTYGWRRYAVRATFENGKLYDRMGAEDPYLTAFLKGKCTVRDYCLDCKFSDHHAADITIADFWLFEKLSGLNNPKGISLVLCHTERGMDAVKALADDYVWESLELTGASYNQKETKASDADRQRREAFLHTYKEKGLTAASARYFPLSMKNRMRYKLSRILHRAGGGKP